MMSLQELIDEVKALNPEEQRQLQELLNEVLAQQAEAAKMDAFHRALQAAGLVKTVKRPRATNPADRRLIEVKGKPLSETIIAERR